MRRLALAISLLVLTTACGKKVPLAALAASTPASELQGLASYYAEPYHGRRTASGEIFDSYQELTAAHRTLPFNTMVKVTNVQNGRDVNVRINDRGPFVEGRVIDLSLKAAREIDMVRTGLVPVKLTILDGGPAPGEKASMLYTIQVGAFGAQDAAEALKKDLQSRYRDVTIQTVATAQPLYRVRVGRLTDLSSAESLMKLLREEKFEPFVVRLN